MLINQDDRGIADGAVNEMRALPSRSVISALGSISNGFLFSTTPIILQILHTICDNMDESADSFITSGWLYGSIIGILLFGFLGDMLGYYKGMILSCLLSFLGTFIGCLTLFLPSGAIPFMLGMFRILMGIGSGGSIPIAYTRTADPKCDDTSISKTSSILLLLQSTSWISGPILFYVSFSFFGQSIRRCRRVLQIMLGLSSLPSFISLVLLITSYNTIIYTPLHTVDTESTAPDNETPKSKSMKHSLFITFLGTGITWLLYDLNSYGNTFFSRSIIRQIVSVPNTPLGSTIPLIIAGLFGVPGQFAVHWLLNRYSAKTTQVMGFIILAVLFFISAVGFYLGYQNIPIWKYILFFIYHLTFFFSTCGPGSTTYILPSLLYPEEVLSLFHGICTCMGKLGGAIGATLFPQLLRHFEIPKTLLFSSLVSILGAVLSYICI